MTNLFFDTLIPNSDESITVEEILNDFYSSSFFAEFVSYNHFEPLFIKENPCDNVNLLPSKKELHYYLTQFNCAQLTYILYGYLLGLSKYIIDKLAQPKISYTKMELVFKLLESGICQEIIEKEFIDEISIKNYKRIMKLYL